MNQFYKNHQTYFWSKIKNELRIKMRLIFSLPYKIVVETRTLRTVSRSKSHFDGRFKNHSRIFQGHFRHFLKNHEAQV